MVTLRLSVVYNINRTIHERHELLRKRQIEESGFEKEKELKRIRRDHELALAELNATHRKMMLDVKIDAADGLLKQLGYTRVDPAEMEQLKNQAAQHVTRSEQEIEAIRTTAVDEFRKRFSISASEPMDVTDLFYREKSLQEENQAQAQQIAKLETEVARMRTHIENESARVAKAIEAARTNIQNNIEPGVKR